MGLIIDGIYANSCFIMNADYVQTDKAYYLAPQNLEDAIPILSSCTVTLGIKIRANLLK